MPVRFLKMGSSFGNCSAPFAGGWVAGGLAGSSATGVAAAALGESRPEKIASQSWDSAGFCWVLGAGAWGAPAELAETKSKLLSLPNAVESLLV